MPRPVRVQELRRKGLLMDLKDMGSAALFGAAGDEPTKRNPEFTDFFTSFAFVEVPEEVHIPANEANLAVLAALMGAGAVSTFGHMLDVAFAAGVSPLQVREMIYQGTAYLGIGRSMPFLELFDSLRISDEPLEATATVSQNDRTERGEDAQVEIFGENMRGFSSRGNEDVRHINRWLSANCFGDYYTRSGLDLRLRELCTFCFLAALGGCEPQLTSHAMGNMHIGNDHSYLISVVSALVPYIGYPRCLNALECINTAAANIGIIGKED